MVDGRHSSASGPGEWEELLRHGAFLRRLAHELVGARSDDLVQATWLKAVEQRPADPSRAGGWLRRVATNLAREWRRGDDRKARREEDAAALDAQSEPSAAAVAAQLEAQRVVVEAVQALDEKYRAVVFLRYYEDRTPTEIAQRLGLPLNTVRTQLQRALASLRDRLDARFEGGSGDHRTQWCLLLAPLAEGSRPAVAAAATSAKLAATLAATLLAFAFLGLGIRALLGPKSAPSGAGAGAVTEAVLADPDAPPATLLAPIVVAQERTAELASLAASDVHTIVGEVVDDLGRGIEGAAVELHAPDHLEAATGALLATATSGSDGRFELSTGFLGHSRLAIRRAGFTSAHASASVDSAIGRMVVGAVRLHAARTLRGVVRDAGGHPVPDVVLLGTNEVDVGEWDWPVAVSAGDGSFELAGLPLAMVFINAFAPGFAAAHAGPFDGTRQDVTVVLTPEASPTLVVTAKAPPDGQPVGAGWLHFTCLGLLTDGPGSDYFRLAPALEDRALTADGVVRCDDLPAGCYEVSLWGDHIDAGRKGTKFTLEPGELRAVTIPFARGRSRTTREPSRPDGVPLRGRVLTDAGAPAAGVEIRLGSNGPLRSNFATTQTDRDGTFSFDHVPPQKSPLRVELEGWFGNTTVTTALEVSADAPNEGLEWRVPAPCYVTGRLVYTDGTPCSGRYLPNNMDHGREYPITMADGRFVAGPFSAAPVEIRIIGADFGDVEARRTFDLTAGESITDVDWRITPAGAPIEEGITGELAWSDGRPLTRSDVPNLWVAGTDHNLVLLTVRPRFRLAGDSLMPPLKLSPQMSLRGFWRPSKPANEFSVTPEYFVALGAPPVRLLLPPAAELGAVRLHFVAAANVPLLPTVQWGVNVPFAKVSDMSASVGGTSPLVDGTLMLRGFPPGSSKFSLLDIPGVDFERDLEFNGNETIDLGEVVLAPHVPHYRGTVVDENGAPIEGALVQMPSHSDRIGVDPDVVPREGSVVSGDDGSFEYVGSVASSNQLVVTKKGFMKKSLSCRDDGDDFGDVVLLSSGQIKLIGIPADVNGVHAWTIRLIDLTPDGHSGYRSPLTGQGMVPWPTTTELGPLPIGRYRLWFFETDDPPGVHRSDTPLPPEPSPHHAYCWEVDVTAGATTTIDLGKEW